MIFKDLDYTVQRLNRTVVRIKGTPVYIKEDDEWMWAVINIRTGDMKVVDIRKQDIDLNPVPLGYVNIHNSALYLSRIPARRWKQGLAEEALDGYRGNGLTNKALALCIDNEYPSIAKCYTSVRKGVEGMAFSRDFAVQLKGRRCVLKYKGKGIGFVTKGSIELDSKFDFLQEALQEAVQ